MSAADTQEQARPITACMGVTQVGNPCSITGVDRGAGWVGCGFHPARPEQKTVTLTPQDAGFVVHMLRAMLKAGMAGDPTKALVARIEAEL